jgi:hypothetical protein
MSSKLSDKTGSVIPSSSGDGDSGFRVSSPKPFGGSVDCRPSPMEKQGAPEGPKNVKMIDTGRSKSSKFGSQA